MEEILISVPWHKQPREQGAPAFGKRQGFAYRMRLYLVVEQTYEMLFIKILKVRNLREMI